jgi:hypothetical protein
LEISATGVIKTKKMNPKTTGFVILPKIIPILNQILFKYSSESGFKNVSISRKNPNKMDTKLSENLLFQKNNPPPKNKIVVKKIAKCLFDGGVGLELPIKFMN